MTRPAPENERFLSRWSRLKRAQTGSAETNAGTPPAPVAGAAASTVATPVVETTAPPLPAIESLTMESDYAQFFQPKVPESLRRAAVKKLFADPHFNVMDGLDTYIDDYSKFEPIPPEMLARLVQARDIIDHPSNRKVEDTEEPPAVLEGEPAAQAGELAAAEPLQIVPEAQLTAQPPAEPATETAIDVPTVPDTPAGPRPPPETAA